MIIRQMDSEFLGGRRDLRVINCITHTSGQKTFFCVNMIFVPNYEHRLGDLYTGSV